MKVETVAQAARLADIDILKDLVDCGKLSFFCCFTMKFLSTVLVLFCYCLCNK